MTRTATNFFVDVLAFCAFVLLTTTGLIERYLLPPGTGRFQSLWGLDRHQWGNVHYWVALVLMAALALHILLHWKWIVCVVRGRQRDDSGGRIALGFVGLVGLAGLAVAPFMATVEQTGSPGRRQKANATEHRDGLQDAATISSNIDGSMTLEEIERTTGVAARTIIEELGLPASVPRDQKLGRLRREYSFEMESVRQVVAEHASQP